MCIAPSTRACFIESFGRLFGGGTETKGGAVDAETLAGRLRPVLEHVAQVSLALAASDFHPRPALDRVVRLPLDSLLLLVRGDRLVERRPASARIVLGLRADIIIG